MRRNRWSPLRFGDPRKRRAAREAHAASDWISPADAAEQPQEPQHPDTKKRPEE